MKKKFHHHHQHNRPKWVTRLRFAWVFFLSFVFLFLLGATIEKTTNSVIDKSSFNRNNRKKSFRTALLTSIKLHFKCAALQLLYLNCCQRKNFFVVNRLPLRKTWWNHSFSSAKLMRERGHIGRGVFELLIVRFLDGLKRWWSKKCLYRCLCMIKRV